MTTIDNAVSVPAESVAASLHGSSRVLSIDIFRGLTMAVMIFVNALAGVPGLPWWTYHAHANEDVMTYVDMVFPFFLFIVGMSLPLSVAQRLKRDPSLFALWLHVVLRSASLIGLGLILANAEKADASRMGISGNLWALLGLLSAALYLNVYPRSKRFPTYSLILRGIGLVGIVILFAIFRRTTHSGSVAWIDPSYPEILGLIGFSYLAVSLLYIPTRRWRWAPAIWFLAMLGLCIVSTAKLIAGPNRWPIYFWPFSNGSMACIVMAGVVTSQVFLGTDRRPTPRRAMSIATGFGILVLIAGWVCTPLGISKIRATPTWSLYSIGASILLFTVLYWICDVKHLTAWAFPVKAAGANTLLTYLLPDLWYFLSATMGVTYLDTHLAAGWPAVVKTIAFTVLMLGLASVLTKARLRLQL
jgi:heparan-alpha-glucosaminide N-acetyltransferase